MAILTDPAPSEPNVHLGVDTVGGLEKGRLNRNDVAIGSLDRYDESREPQSHPRVCYARWAAAGGRSKLAISERVNGAAASESNRQGSLNAVWLTPKEALESGDGVVNG
ncbi:MAG: hypothetical protein AB7S41_02485 [Parvibaculaceae bacterium]